MRDPCFRVRCKEGLGGAPGAPPCKGDEEAEEEAPAKETEAPLDRKARRVIAKRRECQQAQPSAADLI